MSTAHPLLDFIKALENPGRYPMPRAEDMFYAPTGKNSELIKTLRTLWVETVKVRALHEEHLKRLEKELTKITDRIQELEDNE